MSKRKRTLDKLKGELVRAHQQTPEVDLDQGWRGRLMAELKGLSRPRAVKNGLSLPAVDWSGPILKFAGAAALAAMLVAVYVWLAEPDLAGDFARLALGDPVDLLSLQLFGAVGTGVLL
jgi:hypothetical protein